MRSVPSQPTGVRLGPEWFPTPAGQWHRAETAFSDLLEDPRLREEALRLHLDPNDLDLPQGTPEEKLALFARENPDLDLQHPPKDPMLLAVGVLRMLAAPPEE